jgi:ethanolamine permease
MTELQRTLGPLTLWGLGVGYVISGEYFGWNLGLPLGGTYGMLAATVAITVMYVAFVLSYTELACAIPRAGGGFVYADRALGRFAGFVTGLAQMVEFVFAPPAIAMAIGAYVEQRFAIDPRLVATCSYFVFTAINIWGVRQAAALELVVTVLAVFELCVFIAVVSPSFSIERFAHDPLPKGGIEGVFASLPFAIWFYLGIEGVANAAEEAKDPQRSVALGFGSAMATLVVLALGVYVAAIGVAGWESVVFDPAGSTTTSDAPLPLALRKVVDKDSILYSMLLTIGLFGLIASFHGILLAAGRATMELGRSGLLPRVLGTVHERTRTPIVALLLNLVLGIAAIWSGKTADIITLSCFGAIALYVLSLVSLFALRRKEPDLPRSFRAVFYPFLPGLALFIALVSLVAMVVYYPLVALAFALLLAIGCAHYAIGARNTKPRPANR